MGWRWRYKKLDEVVINVPPKEYVPYKPPPYVEPTDAEMILGLGESEHYAEACRLTQLKKENTVLKRKLTILKKKYETLRLQR